MRVSLFVTCFNDTLFPTPAGRWCGYAWSLVELIEAGSRALLSDT